MTPPLRITFVTGDGWAEIHIGLLDPTGADWQLTVRAHDEGGRREAGDVRASLGRGDPHRYAGRRPADTRLIPCD
jgi:hypothetical protein